MKNYLKKATIIGSLILAGGVYSGGSLNNNNSDYEKSAYETYESSKLEKILKERREEVFEKRMEEQSSEGIKIPNYKLRSNHCSEYAKLSANKLFKKKYNPGDAWDLKYDNKIVYKFKENEMTNDSTVYESIRELIIGGTLKPGMLVVTKRDMKPNEYKRYKSGKKAGLDKKGNKIEDTHVILYLGINNQGEPEFSNQWVNQIEKITTKDFGDRKNLKPTLIIDAPDKISK